MTAEPNSLLLNVHNSLVSANEADNTCRGKYAYYHYCCDKVDDRGWGCGYRTLQTLCSWVYFLNGKNANEINNEVPSIQDIQKSLVKMNDKSTNFVNSRQWIGSFEVCLCLDYFYDIPCKIVHVKPGKLYDNLHVILKHFNTYGSPIMMGGNIDASSKGIVGIRLRENVSDSSLLVIDPHCSSKPNSAELLLKDGWVKWHHVSTFDSNSFYNFCLPQCKYKQ